jgi:DNA-binding response OmpR family regulator
MKTSKKCIYILEDNDDIRELLAYLLTEENYEVHGYPTIKSFRNKMLITRPDMVVLDVMLGDGNGMDVCDELKSNQQTIHIPVLMMSAHAYLGDIKQKCDAEDFISKPFDISDFVRKVDHYLH